MRLPFIQGSSVLVIATLFWSTIATGVFQAARWLVPLLVGACFIERGCSPYTEGTVLRTARAAAIPSDGEGRQAAPTAQRLQATALHRMFARLARRTEGPNSAIMPGRWSRSGRHERPAWSTWHSARRTAKSWTWGRFW